MNARTMLPSPLPVPDHLWNQGTIGTTISVGDLWVTSWDGADLSLVLIAGVHDTHVTVWLVTNSTDWTPAAPSFELDTDWMTGPLVCWPEAQAGMSTALLDRRLGTVLTARDVRAVFVDTWEANGQPHANVNYFPAVSSEAADNSLDNACRYVSMLSDLDTPTSDAANRGVLDPHFKQSHGISSPRDLRGHLEGSPATVTTAFNGERLLTHDEIQTLADAHHVDTGDVTTHPADSTVRALRHPKWKARVHDLMTHQGVDEVDARLGAWERAQIAARQARPQDESALDARIDQAINELLSE